MFRNFIMLVFVCVILLACAPSGIGIDTDEDLERARQYLRDTLIV